MTDGAAAASEREAELEKYLRSGEWMYKSGGVRSVSYDGMRAFAVWLAGHGMTLQTVSSEMDEVGVGRSVRYRARVRVRDANTGVVFEGMATHSKYVRDEDGTSHIDDTAETKAHSKAERNGIKKHLPAGMLARFAEGIQQDGKRPGASSGSCPRCDVRDAKGGV